MTCPIFTTPRKMLAYLSLCQYAPRHQADLPVEAVLEYPPEETKTKKEATARQEKVGEKIVDGVAPIDQYRMAGISRIIPAGINLSHIVAIYHLLRIILRIELCMVWRIIARSVYLLPVICLYRVLEVRCIVVDIFG